MRRLLAVVLFACFGLPLLAAAPNAFYVKPTVVVYPFTANGSSIDREASSRLATLIAEQMAATGQVTVIPAPPGTERKDYLSAARAHSADYYVAGYISPLGNGVSVVEQIVSATSGIVVFSQSAQLNTYNEAAGQGDDLATFISRHANRGLVAIGTPPPQQAATPTPAPSNHPEANLGKLFGRKKPAAKPTATPTAKPIVTATAPAAALTNQTTPPNPQPRATTAPRAVAAAPVPTSTPVRTAAAAPPTAAPAAAAGSYAVVGVEGNADATLRELAVQRLLARTNGERAQSVAGACAAHPVHGVLTGNLTVRPDAQFGGGSASFELTVSDCAGKVIWRQTHSNDAGGAQGQQLATERAVDAAVGAYLNPPRRRR